METTSTTNSATRGIITALGAGSGIDMVQLASDLATAQFAGRIDRLTARSERLEAQISAASNLKSMLLNLSSSLGNRVRVGDLSRQPSLDHAGVASASLSGTRQPTGTFGLEVTRLATSQNLASSALASPAASTGAGTLTLRFGTVAGASFTADAARDPVDIAIPAGATLTQVAAAINGAGAGVSAYVANTVDGAQLVLKGQEGAANDFVIEATEDPLEPGLSALAWSPGSATGTLLASAQDASLKIDGLTVTSPSNHLVDAIPGVTLDLKATNTGAPTTLRFADPGGAITGAMNDLTAALNEIASELKLATDPAFGDLARDPGSLGGSLSRYNRQPSEVSEDQADIAEKQEALRARLQTRFAGVDSRVSASQSTLAFLKNQIAAWNASND